MIRCAVVAGVLAGVAVLSGCGGGDAAPVDGCRQTATEQLFVKVEWDCPDGHTVFTFASNGDRDGFKKVAEGMGGHTLKQGDLWVKMDY